MLELINDPQIHKFIVDTLIPILGGTVIFVKQFLSDRKRASQTTEIKSAISEAVTDLQTWANSRFVVKSNVHQIKKG